MAIDAFVKPLLRIPLFQGLKPLQITEIARRADRIVYRPGEVIIAENSVGDAAILIISGEAVRLSGPADETEPQELSLPEGALLGEMTMLIETDNSSTIIARTTVRALKISRAEMHAQMADDPTLADHFVTKISGRLIGIAAELREIDEALAGAAVPPPKQVAAGGAGAHASKVYH